MEMRQIIIIEDTKIVWIFKKKTIKEDENDKIEKEQEEKRKGEK